MKSTNQALQFLTGYLTLEQWQDFAREIQERFFLYTELNIIITTLEGNIRDYGLCEEHEEVLKEIKKVRDHWKNKDKSDKGDTYPDFVEKHY